MGVNPMMRTRMLALTIIALLGFCFQANAQALCSELTRLRSEAQEGEEGKPASKIMRLFDINENKEYGTFVSGPTEGTPVTCVVRGKNCRSESEWRQLLKPFMED